MWNDDNNIHFTVIRGRSPRLPRDSHHRRYPNIIHRWCGGGGRYFLSNQLTFRPKRSACCWPRAVDWRGNAPPWSHYTHARTPDSQCAHRIHRDRLVREYIVYARARNTIVNLREIFVILFYTIDEIYTIFLRTAITTNTLWPSIEKILQCSLVLLRAYDIKITTINKV